MTAWLGLGTQAPCCEPGSEGQRLRDPAPGRALEAGCGAGEGECVTGSEVTVGRREALETAAAWAQDTRVCFLGAGRSGRGAGSGGFPATPRPGD